MTEADDGRLAELYRRHAAEAIRLAYALTGDRLLAEDLVQDAFVKLAGRLVHLRDPDAFDAYLRRTVVNATNSYFRRKRLERAYLTRSAAEPPNMVRKIIGRPAAKLTIPSMIALSVRVLITQPWAMICIQVPVSEIEVPMM